MADLTKKKSRTPLLLKNQRLAARVSLVVVADVVGIRKKNKPLLKNPAEQTAKLMKTSSNSKSKNSTTHRSTKRKLPAVVVLDAVLADEEEDAVKRKRKNAQSAAVALDHVPRAETTLTMKS